MWYSNDAELKALMDYGEQFDRENEQYWKKMAFSQISDNFTREMVVRNLCGDILMVWYGTVLEIWEEYHTNYPDVFKKAVEIYEECLSYWNNVICGK